MSTMSTITVEKLGKVGARVEGVDVERLRNDDSLPEWCHETLEANGVLGSLVGRLINWCLSLIGYVIFLWMRPSLPSANSAALACDDQSNVQLVVGA